MRVILDTNIFHDDYTLSGLRFRGFQQLCSVAGLELYFPEVVLWEIVEQHVRSRRELTLELDSIKKDTKHYLNTDRFTNVLDEIQQSLGACTNALLTSLREHLYRLDIRVIPCPPVEHRELIRRRYEGRKPFIRDKEGKNEKGYADFLIWRSVVTLMKIQPYRGTVAFVSANSRDFLKKGMLHPDLTKDLEESGIRASELLVYTSAEKLIEQQVPSTTKSIVSEEILQAMKITNLLEIAKRIEEASFIPEVFGLEDNAYEWRFDRLTAIEDLHLDYFTSGSDKSIIAVTEADFACELRGLVDDRSLESNSAFITYSEPHYGLWWAVFSVQARGTLSLEYTQNSAKQPYELLTASIKIAEREFYRVSGMETLYANGNLTGHQTKAVVVEVLGPAGKVKETRVLPTERDYEAGRYVSWEWDFTRTYEHNWYRDPQTGLPVKLFESSARFAGRELTPASIDYG